MRAWPGQEAWTGWRPSAPGGVQPQDIEDRRLKTSKTVIADAEPVTGGGVSLVAEDSRG